MLKTMFQRKSPVVSVEGRKADRAIASMLLKKGSKKGRIYLTEEGKKVAERWIYDI